MKNKERIEAMYKLGYTQQQIAERLGVSRRTVIRALGNLERTRNSGIDENITMEYLRETGRSYHEIGWVTGQSKQSIYQKIGG
jgi:DNA-binding CsgD family transcriptional regulator